MPDLELQRQRPVACSELEASLVYIKFKTSMATFTVTLRLNLVLPWERIQPRGEASEGLAGWAQDFGRLPTEVPRTGHSHHLPLLEGDGEQGTAQGVSSGVFVHNR